MPIPREYRPIKILPSQKARILLVVNDVDYGLEVFNRWGSEYSLTREYLRDAIRNKRWLRLKLNCKYVLRYNNNDGGKGILDCEVIQYCDDGSEEVLSQFFQSSIQGPTVFEIPFYLVK